jgi:hypothetical protein
MGNIPATGDLQWDFFLEYDWGVRPYLTYSTVNVGSIGFTSYLLNPPKTQELNWSHVVIITKTNSVISMMVNGAPLAVTTSANPGQFGLVPQAPLFIGSDFSGQIDDIHIYNRALSAGEVAALYKYESAPPDNSPITNGSGGSGSPPSIVSLVIDPATQIGATSINVVATISGAAPVGGFNIDLGLTGLDGSLPSSVIVPEGQTSVQFVINTTQNLFKYGVVTASAPGSTSQTAQLTVVVPPSLGTGSIGPVGPQGPIGLTGPEGPQGPTGAKGLDGAVGPQGPIGLTGPQGPQGPTGAKGLDGAVGPQGPIGLSGSQGPQGPQGLIGPAGPKGATGPQGPSGPAGVGLVKGAIVFVVTGSPGPSGFTLIGTSNQTYTDRSGKNVTKKYDVYQY